MKMSEQTAKMVKEARGVVIIYTIMALCMFSVYAWVVITGTKEPFNHRTLCLIWAGLICFGGAGFFYFEYRRLKNGSTGLQEEE